MTVIKVNYKLCCRAGNIVIEMHCERKARDLITDAKGIYIREWRKASFKAREKIKGLHESNS